MAKTGLIVEGGGLKCVYSAGVLDAFMDHGITFDYGVGVSAGSANLSSYLANQRGRAVRFYIDHVKDPRYVGIRSYLKTGSFFGVEYIYGTLSNSDGLDPIDYETMMANPTEAYFVCTDAQTGQAHYFRKEEMAKDDYRIVMASSSIPQVCKPVEINGRYYYDGSVSSSIPVQHALDCGCDRLVILTSKARSYVKGPEKNRGFYKFVCRKYPKTIEALDHRHLMYQKEQALMYELEKEGKAMIFCPGEDLKLGTFSKDESVNRRAYQTGIQDAEERMEELKNFLTTEFV